MATHQPHLPPTYGELYDSARSVLDTVVQESSGPFGSREQASDAILGYRRFLGVVGQHLQLLRGPGIRGIKRGPMPIPALPDLIDRMGKLAGPTNTDSGWDHAAARLGVAHDLLATHFEANGGPRTPEAVPLLDTDLTAAAVSRLLSDTVSAVDAWRPLTSAVDAVKKRPGQPLPGAQISQVGQQLPAIRGLVEEVLTTGPSVRRELPELDRVPIAEHVPTTGPPRVLHDSLSALRVLSLLCYRQADGAEHANPGTLHDLAKLARGTTERTQSHLPAGSDSLGRVRRAAARDALAESSHAWARADSAIHPDRVRGLVKAPRIYADAIQSLHTHPEPRIDRAVLTALPRLGDQAADSIDILTRTGDLVRPYPDPDRYQAKWRAISLQEGQALAERFTSAATASTHVVNAVNEFEADPHRRQAAAVPAPERSRRVEQGRDGITR